MDVFLMWSGEASKILAHGLRARLQAGLQGHRYWASEQGIEAGENWDQVLQSSLEKAACGIACLTPENLSNLWIHFEAGTIARHSTGADQRVIPYLLGLPSATALEGPLSRYQAKSATKGDTFALFEALNGLLPEDKRMDKDSLAMAFDGQWPGLEEVIRKADRARREAKAVPPSRTPEDLLNEVLITTRNLQRQFDELREEVVIARHAPQISLGTPTVRSSIRIPPGQLLPPLRGASGNPNGRWMFASDLPGWDAARLTAMLLLKDARLKVQERDETQRLLWILEGPVVDPDSAPRILESIRARLSEIQADLDKRPKQGIH